MDLKPQDEARACLEAVAELATEFKLVRFDLLAPVNIVPLRVLLDHAAELLDGKEDARARKNAGDRARRANKKTPGKKPRPKNPRGRRLNKPAAGVSEA